MVAIFKQVKPGTINAEQFRQDLGVESSGTAASRLSRLRAKLDVSPGVPKSKSTPNGKENGKGKSKKGTSAKKLKTDANSDEDEELDMVKNEDDGSGWVESPRKGPARKGRGKKFKPEPSDEEMDEDAGMFSDPEC